MNNNNSDDFFKGFSAVDSEDRIDRIDPTKEDPNRPEPTFGDRSLSNNLENDDGFTEPSFCQSNYSENNYSQNNFSDNSYQDNSFKQSRNTSNERVNAQDNNENPNKNKYTSSESKTYILKKPTADQIDYINNLVNLISIPPTKEEQENSNEVNKPIIDDIKNPIGKKDSSNILEDYLTNRNNKSRDNTNLQCRSIEDVLDVLSTLKR